MPAAFEGDPARIGERLTRTYFSLWEEPETGMALRAMLSSAVSHESAAQLLRGFLGAALLAPTAKYLPADAPHLRVALATAQLTGVALARYIVQVEAMVEVEFDALIHAVAPSVQRYLTGSYPPVS
ncbi:hypothetical protein [Deinococcus hopiensis]|nr:hypothetical protein [Deinococcus hopiensis]